MINPREPMRMFVFGLLSAAGVFVAGLNGALPLSYSFIVTLALLAFSVLALVVLQETLSFRKFLRTEQDHLKRLVAKVDARRNAELAAKA